MHYRIFTDGGARGNPGPAASAFVFYSAPNKPPYISGRFLGPATNNQAEYQALVLALDYLSTQPPPTSVDFYLDSLLVVNQLKSIYKLKQSHLIPLHHTIQSHLANLISQGVKITLNHIPRSANYLADTEVNRILDANLG